MKRRDFIKGTTAAAAGMAAPSCKESQSAETRPHRWIDRDKCVGCGECVGICPMGAISINSRAEIDPHECAECGVCWRSRICPVGAINPGKLEWPRVIREAFSNPLAKHESTGVPGRGTEGIKTNDSKHRYNRGQIGVFIELGRPALGARFRDVERVTKKFASRGFSVVPDNPVYALIENRDTGAINPEVLDEKVISALVEFILPDSASKELLAIIEDLSDEVETVFNVSVALRADEKGNSPMRELFGEEVFSLPNGKVNIGMAEGIEA